ncbi:MAG: S46 family peptidase, partial [Bacteroidales bacterium]|nr:S46 family peptidase [Bacteroidales bacterium]
MKKYFYFILSTLLIFQISISRADEGMWIPMLLQSLNEKEMQDMGMRISADDIYNINHSSLKDAILLFGGGCTAEIISDEGLILTNHHCGYAEIQRHSTIENDLLTDGFWAMSHEEELSNPGLKVTRLVRMEDVSQKMLEGISDEMSEKARSETIKENAKKITDAVEADSVYSASVRPFYYGNEYYLLVYETFSDIRLVGAPPSNIGKFGGDTDNWMWPRHTGDFSLFRIYVDKNNNPADYSEDNVPYKP